jgi:hypothetical protein
MNSAVRLRVHNGQWVCAEGGGGREVVANRGIPAAWETFSMISVDGGQLRDGSQVALQVHNGLYVCAEGGGGGAVLANRSWRREWETFRLRRVAGAGNLQEGDQIALQAFNGQFVCAEGGGGRELVANRSTRREWETFRASVLLPRRVRVELDRVTCHDTEDVTGGDEFYAMGAGADRFSGKNQVLLSKPFSINDGQTKNFPVESVQRVLFEGTVDAASTVMFAVRFYDEDSNKDWTKHQSMVTNLSKGVSSGLALLGPKGIAAGAVLTVLTQSVGLIMSLDKDDLLGEARREFFVGSLPIGTTVHTITLKGGSTRWSNWSYLVSFKITVS